MKNQTLYAESKQSSNYGGTYHYSDFTLLVNDNGYSNQCWVKLMNLGQGDLYLILESYLKINNKVSIDERELLPKHMSINKAIRLAIIKFDEMDKALPPETKGGD